MGERKESAGERTESPPMDARIRKFFEGPSSTRDWADAPDRSAEARDEIFNPFNDE